MSELRLYLRRDSLQEGTDCGWALLDDSGQPQGGGTRLENLPRARRCRLVLAGDLVLGVRATLPDLPERRLAPLLPAAAEAATLVDADTLHAVVLARGEGGMATLGVVEEAWLSRVLARLAGLGLYPDSALPEYLLLPWEEGSWSVGWQGGNVLARFGKAEGMALDDSEPPVGLILALAERGRPAEVKVYQGSHVGTPDWTSWRNALGTGVESAGAWDWRTAPWPDLPDLMQGKFSPGRGRLDWARLGRTLGWGAALLAGIHLSGMFLDWALLAREHAAIKQEMRVLAERVLPAHAAVVDPPWQVAERLQGLRSASGKPAPDSLLGLLGRFGEVWPAAGGAQVKAITYEAGTLSVSVSGADATWVEQFKAIAAGRGLEIGAQEDKDKGYSLNVRPRNGEDRHGQ